MRKLDLNADLGESWYDNQVGDDVNLMPLLDSCNIACGFHGGDAITLRHTIELALEHGVAIGAHPSFPDRKHFGRKTMEIPSPDLFALLLYQISALKGMTEALGGTVHHVKPHGALYHYLNGSISGAEAFVRSVAKSKIPIVYGPPTGQLRVMTEFHGLEFWPEGFADRAYEPSLHLRPRQKDGACLDDTVAAAEQVSLLREGKVRATDGKLYPIEVKTVCLHGDHPGAARRAAIIRQLLSWN